MKALRHGVCYNPELWPEEEIDRDVVEMKRLGLNFVRIGDFAWSKIEPAEGQFSMDFFLRVLDKLHAAGLGVVYCTPTAAPPVWLTHGHPERCLVDAEGRTMIHGARQHASFEHPIVRAASLRVVEKIAASIRDHPALIAWQIDNEFKCHVAEDFSAAAADHWRVWLSEKFGTIDQLNLAWGTDVWSQRYERFDQVPTPGRTPFLHNASLSTAFRLFSRESVAEFMDEQSEVIRRYSKAPITHNFARPFAVNFERMSRNLDFVSFDDYPDREHWSDIVLDNDLFRPAKRDRGHWLMETSVAHNGWLGNHQIAHPPGFLEAEAVASFALGAEAINYWLWRQPRTGCEMSHSAIMSAWFKPSIGYIEVQAVERAREKLEKLFQDNHVAPAQVALTWSDHGRAMLQTEALGGSEIHEVDFNKIIARWHRSCVDVGLHRELRFEDADLRGTKLLLTPAMPYVSPEFLRKIEDFVRGGGVWICGPLTGLREIEHTAPTHAGLGKVETLAGIETVFSFPITGTGATGSAFGLAPSLAGWCSAFRASAAETILVGTLCGGSAPGLGWLSERKLGAGLIVVMGAEPNGETGDSFLGKLISHYAARAGIESAMVASPGTIVCPRCDAAGKFLWVIVNMDGKGGEVAGCGEAMDALSGEVLPNQTLKIDPYKWRAIQRSGGSGSPGDRVGMP